MVLLHSVFCWLIYLMSELSIQGNMQHVYFLIHSSLSLCLLTLTQFCPFLNNQHLLQHKKIVVPATNSTGLIFASSVLHLYNLTEHSKSPVTASIFNADLTVFTIYRVIHKSLRDFRTRLRNNQDRHGRKKHINR